MNPQLSFKDTLKSNNDELHQLFIDSVDIAEILKSRSQFIDDLLLQMSTKHELDHLKQFVLIAVGGYGREEMHPASDVDLLVLLDREPNLEIEEKLSTFVTDLWDLGLEIGHSVRTLDECINEAKADLSIITNLIESRFICGENGLFERLKKYIATEKIWSSADFYNAKIKEQQNRYQSYGDTAYRVEPNLKEGPGGLRDLQMLGWIVLREYGIDSLKILSETEDYDLLNPQEYEELIEARNFLWQVRFVLHQLTGRKEDRLLFDHQRQLAHSFGYTVDEKNQSIEAFMQRYYKTITQLERLNEILLGLLREQIFIEENNPATPINEYFSNNNNYLNIRDKDCFKGHPPTFWHIFHCLQLHPELKGLTPRTIRELRRSLHLIDDDFRSDENNKKLFIKIISQAHRVNFVLRLMNRYGVLAAYIPAFANIVGRMQYDLFHAYTVDDHTLNVVRNIRRLSTPQGKAENPFCSELFTKMERPMILVLAGIFHDIAKGREGDHSELGAIDALKFCRSHQLSEEVSQTVSWLVKQHLLLSGVAQRKDINDPEVIKEFSTEVGTQLRLDYLYVLTISDIKGTNPTLLTNWKHSLLKELYLHASRFLADLASRDNEIDTHLSKKKRKVIARLEQESKEMSSAKHFWSRFGDDYFQQYSEYRLFWHIKEISEKQFSGNIIRLADSHKQDSTVLLIYAKDEKDLFVKSTSAIEQQRLDIVGASISSTNDNYDLLTFYLLDREGQMLKNSFDKQQLLETIEKNIQQSEQSYSFLHHRMPRQLKHFKTETKITFTLNEKQQHTVILIETVDSAGLLTRIGEVFSQLGINIHAARINTLGEIAEDIFEVTSRSGRMISDKDKFLEIETALIQKLS